VISTGQTIENPVTGERITFHKTSSAGAAVGRLVGYSPQYATAPAAPQPATAAA
jgi:hypothetical protein